MDDKFRINFRVPKEYQTLFKAKLGERKQTDTEFMTTILGNFFNPPPPEIKYVDKIVEVPKIEVKEVIKEIRIDAEGTVKGHTVELSDSLYEELTKLKYNPDTSLDAFVGDICWNRIHWSQKKRSSPTTQINGTSPNTTYETSQARVLYWKKQIAGTESWDEQGQLELQEGIMSDTLLLEKDRNQLIGKKR